MNKIKTSLIINSFLIALLFSTLQANETIKLQLKWFHSFQFAGYYMAKEKGYYHERGLNVEIIERDPSKNNIDQVINGQAHYGVADSAIILYRARGKPVRIIASIFQHSPIVYLSKRSSNIVSPYEMRGKKISYQKGLNDSLLIAMLQNANISEDQYTHVPLDFTAQNFIDDEVDIISVYLSDQPYYLKEKGVEFNIINPLNYGFDFYGDNLFTTDAEINKHPQRVKHFREASIKGWKYALDNVDETITLLKKKYHVKSSIAHLKYEAKVTKELMIPDMVEVGYMDTNRFYRIAKVYEQTQKAKKEYLDTALKELIYTTDKQSNQWLKFFYIVFGLLILALITLWVLYLMNKRLNRLVIEKTQEQNSLLSLFEHGDSVLFRWHNDEHWSIEYVSSNVQNLLGYSKKEFLKESILYVHCIYPKDLNQVIKEVKVAKESQKSFFKHEPYRVVAKDGSIKWVLDYSILNRDENGNIIHVLGYIVDITDHQNIRKNLERFIETQDNILFLTDGEEISFANKKFFDFLGYQDLTSFKKIHHSISELFIKDDAFFYLGSNKNWIEEIQKLEHSKRVVSIVDKHFQTYTFSVSINRFDDKLKIVSLTDITQTMLEHFQLKEKTIHDQLTGALNREYFKQNIKQLISSAKHAKKALGIAFLDIDYFKRVNDTYGHDVGDYVLQELVKTIQAHIQESDQFIRWGGEEFILITQTKSFQTLQEKLETIRKLIENTKFKTIGYQTCSIGATIYNTNETIEATIKRADQALYKAKENGRNGVVVYSL